MPEQQPRIERDKIKQRRPNDLLFDDAEPPRKHRSRAEDTAGHDAGGEQALYEDADDWTREEPAEDASGWDEEAEDDWVLHGEDDLPPQSGIVVDDVYQDDGYEEIHDEEDESGVVWENEAADDQLAFEPPDEIALGQQQESFGFAPEVELAGRRDVRPKPLRPAPSPRPAGSRRTVSSHQARGRRPNAEWDADDQPELTTDLSARRTVRETRPGSEAPMPRAAGSSAESDRFSRTRATMGTTADRVDPGSNEQVLGQTRQGAAKRRRQAQTSPPLKNMPKRDRYGAIPGRRGRSKGLATVFVLALLAAGGWYGYRTVGSEGLQPMIDRLVAFLPLSSSSRTAADTPFGEEQPPDAQSAEQALSDLEQRVRQQGGDAQQAPQPNPEAAGAEGPPIPAFKPLPLGATRSLSTDAPDTAADQAQLAANGGTAGSDDDGGEPSIFEQLWRFLRPG